MGITGDTQFMAAVVRLVRTTDVPPSAGVTVLKAMADELGFRLARQSGSPVF